MSRTGPRPRSARLAALVNAAGLLLLAACAGTPGVAPGPAPGVPPVPAPAATPAEATSPAAGGRADFEQAMQQRAQEAQRQGRLADAAWAWEALSLARPERSDVAAELARVRALLQSRVTLALAQAQQDRQRGDLDRAMRGYLTVLSLQPEHASAAEALRAIERERNERQFLGRFSRQTITRSTLDAAQVRVAPDAALTPQTRNLSEHATMLAAQGETDGAIKLLAPAALAAGAQPDLRRLLAQLHCQRARKLPMPPRAEVVAALRECLRLDPTQDGAVSELKALGALPR